MLNGVGIVKSTMNCEIVSAHSSQSKHCLFQMSIALLLERARSVKKHSSRQGTRNLVDIEGLLNGWEYKSTTSGHQKNEGPAASEG
jgi:hypothetical protein